MLVTELKNNREKKIKLLDIFIKILIKKNIKLPKLFIKFYLKTFKHKKQNIINKKYIN